jgi:hypothetical protein
LTLRSPKQGTRDRPRLVTLRKRRLPPPVPPSPLTPPARGAPRGFEIFRLPPAHAALAALAAAFAVTAGTAAPAHAALGVACPDSTSQPFAPWGDTAWYVHAPGGGFENGAAGWTLTGGARVVSGNESFYVAGAGQSHSLALPAASSATSPPMCIGLLSSQMRLFTSNAGASTSKLRVQVVYGGGTGALLGFVGTTLGVSDGRRSCSFGSRRSPPAGTGASTTSTSIR